METVMDTELSAGYTDWLTRKTERLQSLSATLLSWYPTPVKLTLEIGCGHGHYLTAYATEHAEEICLGVDLITRRITRANQKRDKRHLENLRFLKTDIRELFEVLPEHIHFERIFILFPDPWPKKRHQKNRIIQKELLDILASKTNVGTLLHFRTDHEDHFQWGIETIGSHPQWFIDDEIEWPLEHVSYFQQMMGGYNSLTAVRCDSTHSS